MGSTEQNWMVRVAAIRDKIEQAIARVGNYDVQAVVNAVARDLTKQERDDLFATLLFREVEEVWRRMTLVVERQSFDREADKRIGTVPVRLVVDDAFRKLFRSPFALGDGEKVAWGKATVEQHRERIAMLAKLRQGLEDTIRRHEEAIRLIEEAGATCLEEIQDAVVELAKTA